MSHELGLYKLIENFYPHIKKYIGVKTLYLEIGVCSGFTSKWMLENILTHNDSKIIGIDPWVKTGIPFYRHRSDRVWRKLLKEVQNIKNTYDDKVEFIKGCSQNILTLDYIQSKKFDIIYLDGKHTRTMVISDFFMTWPLLKIGGVMIFDDYISKNYGDRIIAPIKKSIDNILIEKQNEYKLLFKNIQVGIEKIK